MDDAFQTFIQSLEEDDSLFSQERLLTRLEALDQIERQLFCTDSVATSQVESLIARLEQANQETYEAIRVEIRAGKGANSLLALAKQSGHLNSHYDALDEIVSSILHFNEPESNRFEATSEMVFYQPTPARQIFSLIHQLQLTEEDVFIDIGCGLGHVPIVIAICTKARSIGVELEPAYIDCASEAAANLNLTRIELIEENALTANINEGTVFHLYTPFSGTMLRTMLTRLHEIASDHTIRISTLGPCTQTVAQEHWLSALTEIQSDQITIFQSSTRER